MYLNRCQQKCIASVSSIALAFVGLEVGPFDRTAFQWFLMDISVRPGSSSTSDDHLFPSLEWPSASASSSSEVHASRRMSGRRWFSHLRPAGVRVSPPNLTDSNS